jgi:hypothetical protein
MKKSLTAILLVSLVSAALLTLFTVYKIRPEPSRTTSISCCVVSTHMGWPLEAHETSTDGAGLNIIESTYLTKNLILNYLFYLMISGLIITLLVKIGQIKHK